MRTLSQKKAERIAPNHIDVNENKKLPTSFRSWLLDHEGGLTEWIPA